MIFEFRIRRYPPYTIVQPVIDGIVHQEEWMDKSEYSAFMANLRELVDDASRWEGDDD